MEDSYERRRHSLQRFPSNYVFDHVLRPIGEAQRSRLRR
jgi:hypothetical protein